MLWICDDLAPALSAEPARSRPSQIPYPEASRDEKRIT
jgi:hypothetical protein